MSEGGVEAGKTELKDLDYVEIVDSSECGHRVPDTGHQALTALAGFTRSG